MKLLAGALTLICCMFLIGCSPEIPSEGQSDYKEFFKKMSPSEKVIYITVANQWPEKHMRPLRDAVMYRQDAPKDGKIPFADVATVILYINDVAFKHDYRFNNQNYANATFDVINPIWFNQIKECAQNNCQCNYVKNRDNQPTPEVKPIENKTEADISKIDLKNIINYDDYNMLLREVKTCRPAENILLNKLRVQRFIFASDRDEIMKEVMFCKNIELQNQAISK